MVRKLLVGLSGEETLMLTLYIAGADVSEAAGIGLYGNDYCKCLGPRVDQSISKPPLGCLPLDSVNISIY